MIEFVDARCWPLVDLHMPEVVPNDQAAAYLAAYAALFTRGERFALLMDGAELPHHSPTFMTGYMDWVTANHALQQRWCAGAVRLQPDPVARRQVEERMQAWRATGKAPYPTATVADRAAGIAQGLAWLADHQERNGAETPGVAIPHARDHAHVTG